MSWRFLTAISRRCEQTHVGSARKSVASFVVLAAVFIGCFCMYRQGADFPRHFFPDEPGKVAQVADDFRNFRHPALMIEVVSLAARVAEVRPGLASDEDRRLISRIGRTTSALCAAGASVALSMVGFWCAGWAGLMAVAAATGTSPPMLVHAHYFEEDTFLAFGYALTVLAGVNLLRDARCERMWKPLFLLGAAAGIAVSSKFIGIVAVGGALLLVVAVTRGRLRAIAFCTMVVLFIFAAVNHRAFVDEASRRAFGEALGFEARHGVTSHRGLGMGTPNTYFLVSAFRELGPVAMLGVVVSAMGVLIAAHRGRVDAQDLWTLGMGSAFVMMLAWCPIPDARYALPGVVVLAAAGAIGLARVAAGQGRSRWMSVVAPAVVIGAIVGTQGPRCDDMTKRFTNDSRYGLVQWAIANIPPSALVAQDSRAGLGRTLVQLPGNEEPRGFDSLKPVRSAMFVPMPGSLERLKREGVEYVVIVDSVYARFFNSRVAPAKRKDGADRADFATKRAFYDELLTGRDCELVWRAGGACEDGGGAEGLYPLTDPEIRVYRIGSHSQ